MSLGVCLCVFLLVFSACGKSSRSSLSPFRGDAEATSEPDTLTDGASWNATQLATARSACVGDYANELEAPGEKIAEFCSCLLEDASLRWPYDVYMAEAKKYRDRQIKQGIERRCLEDAGLAEPLNPRIWGQENFFEDGNGGTANPLVFQSPQGEPVVVWGQDTGAGNNYQVWIKRRVDGEWLAPELIGSSLLFGINPSAAINANGTIMVNWVTGAIPRNRVMMNIFTPGTGWAGEQTIYTSPGGTNLTTTTALTEAGNACIAWEEVFDAQRPNETYYTARSCYRPGMAWTQPEFTQFGRLAFSAVDSDGNVAVFYPYYGNPGRQPIYTTTYSFATSTWSAPVRIDTEVQDSFSFVNDVRRDSNGNIIVIWSKDFTIDGEFVLKIWGNRFDGQTKTWGQPTQISQIPKGTSKDAALTMLPDNEAFVIWEQNETNRYLIWGSRFTPASGWSTPEPLDKDAAFPAGFSDITSNSKGEMLVTYMKKDLDQYNIWATVYNGSYWQKEQLIEKTPLDTTFPMAYLDEQGNGFVVWRQTDGTKDDNWINYYYPAP